MYVNVHSHSFLTVCLTQCLVGDSGQPLRACHQDQLTDERRTYGRHSEPLDLAGLYRCPSSSSPSESVEYSIKNVLISTDSSISSGRSDNFYNKHIK